MSNHSSTVEDVPTNVLREERPMIHTLEDFGALCYSEAEDAMIENALQQMDNIEDSSLQDQMREIAKKYKSVYLVAEERRVERNEILDLLTEWFNTYTFDEGFKEMQNDENSIEEAALNFKDALIHAKLAFERLSGITTEIQNASDSDVKEELEREAISLQQKAVIAFKEYKDATVDKKYLEHFKDIEEENQTSKSEVKMWQFTAAEMSALLKRIGRENNVEFGELQTKIQELIHQAKTKASAYERLTSKLKQLEAQETKWKKDHSVWIKEKIALKRRVQKYKDELRKTLDKLSSYEKTTEAEDLLWADDEMDEQDNHPLLYAKMQQREKEQGQDNIYESTDVNLLKKHIKQMENQVLTLREEIMDAELVTTNVYGDVKRMEDENFELEEDKRCLKQEIEELKIELDSLFNRSLQNLKNEKYGQSHEPDEPEEEILVETTSVNSDDAGVSEIKKIKPTVFVQEENKDNGKAGEKSTQSRNQPKNMETRQPTTKAEEELNLSANSFQIIAIELEKYGLNLQQMKETAGVLEDKEKEINVLTEICKDLTSKIALLEKKMKVSYDKAKINKTLLEKALKLGRMKIEDNNIKYIDEKAAKNSRKNDRRQAAGKATSANKGNTVNSSEEQKETADAEDGKEKLKKEETNELNRKEQDDLNKDSEQAESAQEEKQLTQQEKYWKLQEERQWKLLEENQRKQKEDQQEQRKGKYTDKRKLSAELRRVKEDVNVTAEVRMQGYDYEAEDEPFEEDVFTNIFFQKKRKSKLKDAYIVCHRGVQTDPRMDPIGSWSPSKFYMSDSVLPSDKWINFDPHGNKFDVKINMNQNELSHMMLNLSDPKMIKKRTLNCSKLIQRELERVTQGIDGFLEYTNLLVESEAQIMANANRQLKQLLTWDAMQQVYQDIELEVHGRKFSGASDLRNIYALGKEKYVLQDEGFNHLLAWKEKVEKVGFDSVAALDNYTRVLNTGFEHQQIEYEHIMKKIKDETSDKTVEMPPVYKGAQIDDETLRAKKNMWNKLFGDSASDDYAKLQEIHDTKGKPNKKGKGLNRTQSTGHQTKTAPKTRGLGDINKKVRPVPINHAKLVKKQAEILKKGMIDVESPKRGHLEFIVPFIAKDDAKTRTKTPFIIDSPKPLDSKNQNCNCFRDYNLILPGIKQLQTNEMTQRQKQFIKVHVPDLADE